MRFIKELTKKHSLDCEFLICLFELWPLSVLRKIYMFHFGEKTESVEETVPATQKVRAVWQEITYPSFKR